MHQTTIIKQPNCIDARKRFVGQLYIPGLNNNLSYSPAYAISNEDIHNVTKNETNGPDVLTVAASGDQPMFYAIGAAKNIDTFDVSYCARAIMDVKTTAIHKLNRTDYTDLMQALSKTCTPANTHKMPEIIPHMPQDTADFIKNMDRCGIFSKGFGPLSYPDNVPTDTEYEKMRQTIKTPFNFIWSDLTDLHTHLTKEYDIINISNIFEWLPPETIVPTINNLRQHLKIGGYIQATVGPDCWTLDLFDQAARHGEPWGEVMIDPHMFWSKMMLLRTR